MFTITTSATKVKDVIKQFLEQTELRTDKQDIMQTALKDLYYLDENNEKHFCYYGVAEEVKNGHTYYIYA